MYSFVDTTEFLLTRPLRDVTKAAYRMSQMEKISTHTPLAGRDQYLPDHIQHYQRFLLTRPLRDVTISACNSRILF